MHTPLCNRNDLYSPAYPSEVRSSNTINSSVAAKGTLQLAAHDITMVTTNVVTYMHNKDGTHAEAHAIYPEEVWPQFPVSTPCVFLLKHPVDPVVDPA